MTTARRLSRIIYQDNTHAVEELSSSHFVVYKTASPLDVLAGRDERIAELQAPPACLTPVSPSKIVCVGRNYRAHAKELGNEVPAEPLLFLKPPSALLAPLGTIVRPPESQRVEHEGELVVVIGTRAKRIQAEQAHAVIAGYTCGNDVTARDIQRKDVQFTRGKGFDTFCPLGPWMVTQAPSPSSRVKVVVNDVEKQNGCIADMVFDIPTLVAYISNAMTLEPGDVIFTGTPEGVGPLVSGDHVSVIIDQVGTLSNVVA